VIQLCVIAVYLITTPLGGDPIWSLQSKPMSCLDAQGSAAVENQVFTGTRSVVKTVPRWKWWKEDHKWLSR
jgi:hypothetical protein